MSKSQRAGNLDIEQVSAKYKPVRGFCLAKRNDGPEAMKEDGRNEDCPGNPAGKNTMRPRFSPKTDCRATQLGETRCHLSIHHQRKIKARVRHVHLGDPANVKMPQHSTHSTERPGVRLTPPQKPQGEPSIDFEPLSDEGKDMKDHIIRNMCSTFGNDTNKLESFSQ